jgi:N12 class adenine-specific DNA methylase
VFDPAAADFADARAELHRLLSPSEWQAAARTTLNAHYTSFDVSKAVWKAVNDAGFTGGRVLEPGVGSGTFLATAPDGVAIDPVGVEVDGVTARIAQALHPEATIRSESFAVTRYPDGWFDVAVGNVPFGDYKLFDPIYNQAGHSIHNHFIAKSLRLTRPGGYVAVLTSRFTLDARSTVARREMATLGDLVGAVRLPEGAMRQVAGTGVAMDLLLLRRREAGVEPAGESWLDLATVQTADGPVQVNEVFARHPDWVLGELRAEHGQYGQDDIEVRPLPGPLAPFLADTLTAIVDHARRSGLGVTPRVPDPLSADVPVVEGVERGRHHVEESLLVTAGGGFAKISNGVPVVHSPPASQAGELRLLIELRDTYFELIDAQARTSDDGPWQASRDRLNELYDRYHRVHGPINRFRETSTGRFNEQGEPIMARRYPAMGGFKDDPGLPVVRSLEHFDDATRIATKAAVFERRVLAPRPVVESAETAEDALALCLDERGAVDLETIARLLGVTATDARAQLGALVYNDPAGGPPLTAADYLSGNVRARLVEAKQAATVDPRWQANVTALEAVQPCDLEPSEIDARLGTPWIPPADLKAFCADILEADVNVEYASANGDWALQLRGGRPDSVTLTSDWGTRRVNAVRLVEACANQRVVSVTDEGPDGQRIPNLPETLAAREKQELLNDRFGRWVWEDPARAGRLAAVYNDRFNSTVLPSYDGSHLTLPGLTTTFRPHDHQRDAVWRILSSESVLLDHAVGAGKTATMVIAGHELKRLGMVNKPAYVVPNHMLEQFSREYLQLYPQANLLVASKDDVSPSQRKEFVARCATEDWDAVIMTQSSFERIPVSAETEQRFLDARMNDLRASIAASHNTGSGLTVKQLEKALARLEERHARLLHDDRRDQGGVTWEAASIDYVVIDEAHMFKNLAFPSHIQGIGGAGSKRAEDLAMKIDWLRETHGNRVATFATATPIANSVAEMYVMQRYLQPDVLRAAGIEHFDGWAANFGRPVTALELAPDGATYRMNTRFARFANVPDLLRMFRVTADVKTAEQLGLPVPDLVGDRPETVVVPSSDELSAYVTTLVERAEAIRNRNVRPEEDNMLKVAGDGRRAALDLRLMGLNPDPSGGKVAVVADRVAAIYERTHDTVYTDPDGVPSPRAGSLQLVFCDLGTPHTDGRWTVYDQLRAELVARGLPAETVRFVHEARNDAEKARLFAAARSGSVAVLIGSTEKMGVGTNVQTRAVALHHMDCPWRPADLEQRDGRIIRQGNQNPDVQILRYATEGSFDVFSWQTVERKATFIGQLMRGDVTERWIDDIGDQALSYSEVKALATGNPLIMERAGVESELTKLQRLEAAHRDDQSRMAQRVRSAERDATEKTAAAHLYRTAALSALDTSGDRFAMVVAGQPYRKRTDAATALHTAVAAQMKQVPIGARVVVDVGQLAGFTVQATIFKDYLETNVNLGIKGLPLRTDTLNRNMFREAPALGLLTRLENMTDADDLTRRAERAANAAEEARRDSAKAASRVGLPFEHTGRLQSLRERLAVIDAELAPKDPAPDVQPTPVGAATQGGGATSPTPATGPNSRTPSPIGPKPGRSAREMAQMQLAQRRAQQQQRGFGR